MINEPITQISPKSLKKISRKKFNLSYEWFIVVFIFIVVSVILILFTIMAGGNARIILFALLSMLWYFFYTHLRNDELLENAKLTYQYYVRRKNGTTLISKYNDASRRLLMQFLGITAILENGLIRYEDNIYFFLIQYTPKRLSDDSKTEHTQNIISLLKTLKDGCQFQFNMNTTTKFNGKYEAQILSAANNRDVPRPVKEHLFSIQKLINKSAKNIHPDFYIMCSIGNHASIAEAQKSMLMIAGGLEYQFKSLDTHFKILTSPEEISLTLYQKMTQGL